MDLLMKIQKEYLSFTNQEQKIADYILRYSHQIKNMKISELAKKIGTSDASITRFVKKIDCDSYSDMKFLINSSLQQEEPSSSEEAADGIYSYYQNVIQNTQRLINIEQIRELIQEIKKAAEITIIGASSSGVTAEIFATRLMRMGFSAKNYSDPLWMLSKASISDPNSLFIAISTSGTTKSVLEALKLAKQNQAVIASITSYSENPIAGVSDYSLHVYNTRFIDNQRFANSQFANVYLIDVITTYLLEDKKLRKQLERTRDTTKFL